MGPGPATTERTALKEWSVVIGALARGDIVALVRKGGIREDRAGFAVRHERFLLYPTYFHENDPQLAPRLQQPVDAVAATPPEPGRVRITHLAHVGRIWIASALDPLTAIADEHALSWAAVESRFHYRGKPGVHVIAVRVARLREPADLPALPRYEGCVSWLELAQDVDVAGAEPALDDLTFARRLAALDRALAPFAAS